MEEKQQRRDFIDFTHNSDPTTQISRFRFRKDPSSGSVRGHRHAKKKSYIDAELLESATEAVLNIVHRGKSEKAREAREREREHIKEHVLRTMNPVSRPKAIRQSFRSRYLPETSEEIAKRKREREERKHSVEPKDSWTVKKPDVEEPITDETIKHFSFVAPNDLSGLSDAVKERAVQIKKQVSFLSPEKSFNGFKTPSRPSPNMIFSQPPPLLKHKRETVIVGRTPTPEKRPKFDFDSISSKSTTSPKAPDAPYDLLGLGTIESIFS